MAASTSSSRLTTLEQLILEYPTAGWNWYYLSANPNVSFQFILTHPEFPWKWEGGEYGVGSNPSVSMNDIDTHPELPWTMWNVSYNPNLDDDHLERWYKTGVEKRIYWGGVSQNSQMTPDFVERHIVPHRNQLTFHSDFWFEYSGSPLITMDFVQKHPDRMWDWTRLTANPAFTISFILNTFNHYPWSLRGLFLRNDLTIDIVKSMDHIPWSMDYILRRIPITDDVIREYWNVNDGQYRTHILENPSFRFSILDALENKRHRRLSKREWGNFTAHPSVTMEFIETHPEFAWNLHKAGSNPNITVDFVDKHSDKINFSDLSSNWFHFNSRQRQRAERKIADVCFRQIITPNRRRRAIRITNLILGKVSGGRLMCSRDCRRIATFITG